MDHLPLPQKPTSTPSRARCVCIEDDPYDGGDFATYPGRAGWPEMLTSHTGTPFWYQQSKIDAEHIDEHMRKQEQVLTSWAFFGQLHMMLSPFGLYKAQDYIEVDKNEIRWLHTRQLLGIVSQWYEAMEACDHARRQALIANAQRCFTLSCEVLRVLSMPSHTRFDRMINVALLAISNVVERMIINFYNDALHSLATSLTLNFDETSRQRMLQNGWCPSDIFRAEHRHVRDVSIIWFSEHMQKSISLQSHDDCTDTICQRMLKYSTRHVEADCACDYLQSDKARIIACLESGDYPVLEVEGEELDDITMRIHPSKSLAEDIAYVAISHVWADGLGNQEEMSLPRCQIRRLAKLVHSITSHTFYRGRPPNEETIVHKKRLFLWCDTLCCPIEQAPKQLALQYMRDVYMKAEWTLVLDRDLLCYSYSEIGVLEAAWRIIHSRWMTRLWTYQEAGLPLRLLVQFSDAPVSIFPVMLEMARMFKETRKSIRLYNYLCAEIVLLRSWLHSDAKQWIGNAVAGLAHRSVSVASDEPLCIATVLGLDTVEMSRTPNDQRMQLLWEMICRHEQGVKKSVVFNTLARMDKPGFRCFPSSFLQSLASSLDYISLSDDPGRRGILCMQGLRVSCAGWRIRLAQRPACIPEVLIARHKLNGQVLPVNFADGSCYNMMRRILDDSERNQGDLLDTIGRRDAEWYVVLKRSSTFDWVPYTSQQQGILVSKEKNAYGLTYYRTHMLVNVDRVQPRQELSRRLQYIYAHTIWRSWPVKAVQLMNLAMAPPNFVLTWPPVTLSVPGLKEHNTIAAWLQPVFNTIHSWSLPTVTACYRTLFGQIWRQVRDTNTRALQEPLAARLWKEAGNTATELTSTGDVLAAVMGRYVDALEVYDESTEWVID
ncbi:hypothetical protein AMS68_004242 [Peltaster fructicola]|uniref:Heterokaryon incompatibility domain-containing protein n=1 Tax=Peltaster fructicola TaxID=286661 RepID=A0A6H0XVP4_9PEZI|nr:hypothetical protein AMS68_004242 [Peltaster fructicola]